MSKPTVMDRKDLKQPDKFQEAAVQAASWMASRKKHVVLAGAVAVGVLAIVVVFAAVQAQRAEAAGSALGSLLGAAGGDISSVPLPGMTGPVYPNEEAKQRAVISKADELLAGYGQTRAAELAALVKGDAHYQLREWDQAGQAYDRYLKETPKEDPLRFGALEGLALVAEAKGDLGGAAQGYERMASEAPRFADRADLERARVLEAAGKTAEARAILAAFSDRHKESLLAPQAAQQLGRLGAR